VNRVAQLFCLLSSLFVFCEKTGDVRVWIRERPWERCLPRLLPGPFDDDVQGFSEFGARGKLAYRFVVVPAGTATDFDTPGLSESPAGQRNAANRLASRVSRPVAAGWNRYAGSCTGFSERNVRQSEFLG